MKTKLDLKDNCQLKEFSDFLNGCKYTKVVFKLYSQCGNEVHLAFLWLICNLKCLFISFALNFEFRPRVHTAGDLNRETPETTKLGNEDSNSLFVCT